MSAAPENLMAGFLTTDEASAAIGISTQTLRKWRMVGKGPKPCRIGGRVFYRRTVLADWIETEASQEY